KHIHIKKKCFDSVDENDGYAIKYAVLPIKICTRDEMEATRWLLENFVACPKMYLRRPSDFSRHDEFFRFVNEEPIDSANQAVQTPREPSRPADDDDGTTMADRERPLMKKRNSLRVRRTMTEEKEPEMKPSRMTTMQGLKYISSVFIDSNSSANETENEDDFFIDHRPRARYDSSALDLTDTSLSDYGSSRMDDGEEGSYAFAHLTSPPPPPVSSAVTVVRRADESRIDPTIQPNRSSPLPPTTVDAESLPNRSSQESTQTAIFPVNRVVSQSELKKSQPWEEEGNPSDPTAPIRSVLSLSDLKTSQPFEEEGHSPMAIPFTGGEGEEEIYNSRDLRIRRELEERFDMNGTKTSPVGSQEETRDEEGMQLQQDVDAQLAVEEGEDAGMENGRMQEGGGLMDEMGGESETEPRPARKRKHTQKMSEYEKASGKGSKKKKKK
ncbi:hypothetical protein PENTCL1PPCAC_18500, partial [Pristionchus entomophagus]